MDTKSIEKQKRSVSLSKDEIKFLKDIEKKAESTTAAAISLGISKDVLSRTIAFGSCSEKTYNKLFQKETV